MRFNGFSAVLVLCVSVFNALGGLALKEEAFMENTKPKRKQKSEQTGWLAALLSPVRFEIITPLPVDECGKRLQNHTQHGWTYPGARVEVSPVDDDICEFRVQSQGRFPTLEADGTLERWDDLTTMVTGEVRTPPLPYRVMTAVLALPPVLLLILERNPRALTFMPEYLLLAAFIASVTILVLSLQRGHLVKVIANTLTR